MFDRKNLKSVDLKCVSEIIRVPIIKVIYLVDQLLEQGSKLRQLSKVNMKKYKS